MSADCTVIVANHSCYDGLDLEWAKKLMRPLLIVDGRNLLDGKLARGKRFGYLGIGKDYHHMERIALGDRLSQNQLHLDA